MIENKEETEKTPQDWIELFNNNSEEYYSEVENMFKAFSLFEVGFSKIERLFKILDKSISPAYKKAKKIYKILEKHRLINIVLNKTQNLDKILGFNLGLDKNSQNNMIS